MDKNKPPKIEKTTEEEFNPKAPESVARDYFNSVRSVLRFYSMYENEEGGTTKDKMLEKIEELKKDEIFKNIDEYLKHQEEEIGLDVENFPENVKNRMQTWYDQINAIKDFQSAARFALSYENYDLHSDKTPKI